MICPTCGGPQLTERPHIHLGDVVLPPSQPPGWVDPDPLHVEPEPVRRHVRYQGWDLQPLDHEFALVGLGVCLGIVIFALLFTIVHQLDPAPSSGQTTIEAPRDLSGLRVGASAALSGASVPPSSRDPEAAGATASPETAQPSPGPTGAIGRALIGGWATWYETPGYTAAAGPALRAALGPNWRGQLIEVQGPARFTVVVVLSDWCACGPRDGLPTILDLSRTAFAELADPSVGIVAVSIELRAALPRTDADVLMHLEVRSDEVYR